MPADGPGRHGRPGAEFDTAPTPRRHARSPGRHAGARRQVEPSVAPVEAAPRRRRTGVLLGSVVAGVVVLAASVTALVIEHGRTTPRSGAAATPYSSAPQVSPTGLPSAATSWSGVYTSTWVFAETGANGPGTATIEVGAPIPYATGLTNGSDVLGKACSAGPGNGLSGTVVVPFAVLLRNTGAKAQTFALSLSGLEAATSISAETSVAGATTCYGQQDGAKAFGVEARRLAASTQRRIDGFFVMPGAAASSAVVTVLQQATATDKETVNVVLIGGPNATKSSDGTQLPIGGVAGGSN